MSLLPKTPSLQSDLSPEERLARVNSITSGLELNDDKLKYIMNLLETEFNQGLSNENDATIKMLLTYVRDIPKGNEVGMYMALDLGGTNFRVLTVALDGSRASIDTETCEIPAKVMIGSGRDLFDRIADCVYMFIRSRNITVPVLPIGFTFSFPLRQEGLASAKLIRWTKGFKCTDVVGADVVALLRESLEKRKGDCKVKCEVVAVINDTTGTLMSCAHRNRECRVGLIVGTGTNLCYMEKLSRIPKWKPPKGDDEKPRIAVNCEWGAFGDNGVLNEILTDFDRQVDANSLNQGMQIFEKLISGMYLGELARLVLLHLHRQDLLCPGVPVPSMLVVKGGFSAKHLSRIASRREDSIYKVFTKIETKDFDSVDVDIVKHVCDLVAERASRLVAAGLSVVLNRLGREKKTTIGYDGSVMRFHPFFRKRVEQKIKDLCRFPFDLMLSEDGSGRGAALVAAIACKNFDPKMKI
ncbi:hexokinase-2-like [Panonychus citri]|uniref:hexokinase-2-like n=1 Tax=Panonychus citri TaxID=50023 RepID=UPI002306E3BD|nr:hexokinase-2-like [Panonychus citri]